MSAARPTLLLLPGLLNDGDLWREQIAALSGEVDCVVGDISRGDSMQAIAGQVLEGLPARFALAGFSLGGYVAQAILRIAPHRVQRLALLDTSARSGESGRAEVSSRNAACVRRGTSSDSASG